MPISPDHTRLRRDTLCGSSTLIKEVKLCVGPEPQKALDLLYEKLTTHQMPAEQAVKQLMELVGSTVVQQASARLI